MGEKADEADDEIDIELCVQDQAELERLDAGRDLTRWTQGVETPILVWWSCTMGLEFRRLSEIDVLGIKRCKKVVTK